MQESEVRALVESKLATIPDFPEQGVVFRDLTPVFGRPPRDPQPAEVLSARLASAGVACQRRAIRSPAR